MKNKNSILAVIIFFAMFMLTACSSYSEESSALTAPIENTDENIGENIEISVMESIPEDKAETTNNLEQHNMATEFDFE